MKTQNCRIKSRQDNKQHRTASVNEYSGRYSKMELEFWQPEDALNIRRQSLLNKQGSDGVVSVEVGEEFVQYLLKTENLADVYEELVKKGVDRGLARVGLPISIYTQWYWKIDLKNLLHFLNLRMNKGAQEEIRVYANEMFKIMKRVCPVTTEAFQDYVLDAVTFSGPEIRAMKCDNRIEWAKYLSRREERELEDKMTKLREGCDG